MLQPILKAFGLSATNAQPFGTGLINNTWKIVDGTKSYILQRINNSVFKQPEDIAFNIAAIDKYLKLHYPDYLFIAPLAAINGQPVYHDTENGYFRVMPFLEGSHTVDVVEHPEQAYEAAAQFGKFTRLLENFNAENLRIPLPDFHNLSLRYKQFETALKKGNPERIGKSAAMIETAGKYKSIVTQFESIKQNPQFKIRVTHHDTKISNVLLDYNNNGLCVIDLDTVMPGYFFSDAGDMIRTYLSPVSEEESNLAKIEIRQEYFEALAKGYFSQMNQQLTAEEKDHFVYAGKFMIYMQAIRFLTDYLNNDIYYGCKYEGHNFVRAGNQFTLLEKLIAEEPVLQQIVSRL